MAQVTEEDILWKKSELISDDDPSENGGKAGEVIAGGIVSEIFNPVYKKDRQAGRNSFRKFFLEVRNTEARGLSTAHIWLHANQPQQEVGFVLIDEYSLTSTQPINPLYYSENFGLGWLASDVKYNESSILVSRLS